MLAGLDHSTSSCLVRGSRMVDILDECLPPPPRVPGTVAWQTSWFRVARSLAPDCRLVPAGKSCVASGGAARDCFQSIAGVGHDAMPPPLRGAWRR